MIRALPLVLAAMLLGLTAPVASPQTLDGITIGSNVRTVVKVLGNPDVVNTDVGHVWTWHNAKTNEITRVTTDDDGVVDMVDISAPSDDTRQVAASIGTEQVAFTFGSDHFNMPAGLDQAAKTLSLSQGSLPDTGDPAEFWRFPATESQQLILTFETSPKITQGPLREIFLGNIDALADAGLIPDKAADDAQYRAPLLDTIGSADYNGGKSGVVYSRIVINSNGAVAKSTIFISSGDAQLDEIALAIANGCTFEAATVRGRKTTGVYFRRENFPN